MNEKMTPISFDKLIYWMRSEYESSGSIFGIDKCKFYKTKDKEQQTMFESRLGTLVGPAAGPNTQLAQNILSAYLSGFRFIELKTVQTLDGEDLAKLIPRPCINAQDEGYNCEWSTELTTIQAYEEYVKAWFLLHIVAKEYGLSGQPDFIFNMSVGYDYEGITSSKIDKFINEMMDAGNTEIWSQCKSFLLENVRMFRNVTAEYIEEISPKITNSITLSTLHGCPSQEIEKIAEYFLTEKKLHTYVKLNPTLLGYEFVRNTLNEMGYDYISFDTTHFNQDLKMGDALSLIERLMQTASQNDRQFGVKVSNTFPVQIKKSELPAEYMYMSGRALFALSVNLAKQLSTHFDGNLKISYSGGADYFNIDRLISAGIKPVTVATTILKPGGYVRARQLCEKINHIKTQDKVNVELLCDIAEQALSDKHSIKEAREVDSRKVRSKLRMFNCFISPCQEGGCPINQQIPAYLDMVSKGKYEQALKIITIDNPLPGILGEICTHFCQDKCTRIDYERSLQIRNAKKIAADKAQKKLIREIEPSVIKTNKKAAIIGAGPAGISAAVFLRRNGVEVTVFEKLNRPMGVVSHIIPKFRIDQKTIDRDVEMAEKQGVKFVFGADDNYDIEKLKKDYGFIVIATGAWMEGRCPVEEGEEYLVDALDFLKESRQADCKLSLGKNVAVIGGGDVAMDCARAAARANGVENVHIVYRRTKEFMPAQKEEIDAALAEGVVFKELLSPISCSKDTLKVCSMRLGDMDVDGRRKTLKTDETNVMYYDTVISAIGARVDCSGMENNGIDIKATKSSYETNVDNVYLAGDCRKGAATIVEAVADAKVIAKNILEKCGLENDFVTVEIALSEDEIGERKAVLSDAKEGREDAERCLSCGQVCEICCEVCPNRANIRIDIDGAPQIVHIDGMCNHCGNCSVFCPHIGDPAKDKATLFWNRQAFEASENKGWMFLEEDNVLVRDINGKVYECSMDSNMISPMLKKIINTVENEKNYIY